MKKMNTIYIIWAILIILLVGVLTVMGFTYKNKLKSYKNLETKLSEAAKKYVELKFLYPEDGQIITINLEDMLEAEVINDLTYEEETCTGYVELSYNGVYNYDAFIKCNNYVTKGY